MTNQYDEEAFVREMQHKETMNENRIDAIKTDYEIKDDENEIN